MIQIEQPFRRDRAMIVASLAVGVVMVVSLCGLIGLAMTDRHQMGDVRRDLAKTVVGGGWALLELRPLRMSLEEIFLHVTTEDVAAPAAVAEAHSISSEQVAHE